MSILIKDIPLCGYEISIMKDGERYRARVDGIWCEVEEIPTTEPDTDTISRQAAIDAARKCAVKEVTPAYMLIDKAEAMTELMQLPSIQPKRGRWIDDGSELGCQCSQCGKTLDEYINCGTEYMTLTEIPKFCPNCGADMR